VLVKIYGVYVFLDGTSDSIDRSHCQNPVFKISCSIFSATASAPAKASPVVGHRRGHEA